MKHARKVRAMPTRIRCVCIAVQSTRSGNLVTNVADVEDNRMPKDPVCGKCEFNIGGLCICPIQATEENNRVRFDDPACEHFVLLGSLKKEKEIVS